LEFIGYEVPFRNENYLIRIPVLPFPNQSFRSRKEDEAEENKRVLESCSSVRFQVLTKATSENYAV
jgi:glutathione peroxidase-family protein